MVFHAQHHDISRDVDKFKEHVLQMCDKYTIHTGLAQRSGSTRRRIKKLLQTGLLEYTIPEKPNSRLQKYRLVKK